MKKGIIMSVALVISLATLTGCGNSKTKKLTCDTSKTDNGFTKEEQWVFELENNRVKKATNKYTIIAEGDYSQYLEDYKNDAENSAKAYNEVTGISAKAEQKSNKTSLTVEYETKKMDEKDIESYGLNESYESLKDIYTNKGGYTCK